MHKRIKRTIETASLLWENRSKPFEELPEDLKEWLLSGKNRQEIFDSLSDDKKIAEMVGKRNRIDTAAEWRLFERKFKTARRRKLIYLISAAAAVIAIPVLSFLIIEKKTAEPELTPAATEFTLEGISPGRTLARLIVDDSAIEIDGNMRVDTESGTQIFDSEGNKVFSSAAEETQEAPATPEARKNILQIPRGGVFSLRMEDGTQVWLNSESELSFPDKFTGPDRKVGIKGEAFFDVASDGRPFIIETGNVTVRVTGTAFNVRNYPDEANTTVAVLEGSVRVGNNEGIPYADVSPGLQLAINERDGITNLTEVNMNKILAWKNNMFVFIDDDLESIARELGRWYDTNITVDEALRGNTYSGTVHRFEQINAITDIFRRTGEMDFVRNKDGSISIVVPQRTR